MVVFAAVACEVGEQLEKQLGNVGGVLRGIAVRVGHFDNELDAITVIEEDLYYSQLASHLISAGRNPAQMAAAAAVMLDAISFYHAHTAV